MLSDIAVRAENLGKKYHLGVTSQFSDTLRDSLAAMFRHSEVKSLDSFWALKGISFEVKHGEVIGIIGHNGAGKSTLLKILSRITEPTEGYAEINGRVGSLLEVGTGFHPELTGGENIYLNGAILGMRKREIKRKFDEIVAFAEIEKFLETPVKHYSSGMYVRLAFAVAAHLEPEILLVDEVLSVGDYVFQKKCLGKMGEVAKEGRTVFFVSHNIAAIQHLCEKAFLLSQGRLIHSGPTAETVEKYEQYFLEKGRKSDLPAHVIYELDTKNGDPCSDFEIVRIETLDHNGQPKPKVFTWDRTIFRVTYWAKQSIQQGSAVLEISSWNGVPLFLSSTQPDLMVPMTIKPGYHSVECEFESLPISAGEYFVGAGLAIPHKEWLCRRERLATLTIYLKDVYKSGMAPVSNRCLIATPHVWRVN